MAFKEKTFYQAVCDKCGEEYEGGEFQWWYDQDQAADNARDDSGWFERKRVIKRLPPSATHPIGSTVYQTVELICDSCQTCDVCGTKPAYELDDHLVCEEHEDHVFEEEKPVDYKKECTGDTNCPSPMHVHGCYADNSFNCDDPQEHVVPTYTQHRGPR